MRKGNKQVLGWAWVWGLLLVGLLLPNSAVLAQSGPPQVAVPPARTTIDGNGVDLYRGAISISQTYMSLGSGSLVTTYSRTWVGNGGNGVPGWRDSLIGGINQNGTQFTVSVGDVTETFTSSGGSFTNNEGTGSTLTFDSGSGHYIYMLTDGRTAVFDPALVNPVGYTPYDLYASSVARIISVGYPLGIVFTYEYETDQFCTHRTMGDCDSYGQAIRLMGFHTNSGYRMQLHYVRDAALPAFNPTLAYAALPYWLTPASVAGQNMIDCVPGYCTTPSGGFPTVTMASAASGTDTVWSIGDPMSRTSRYRIDSSNNITGIFRPTNTGSTPNVSITYYGSGAGFAAGRVLTYTQDGRIWTYLYSENTTTHTVTTSICDPSIATASCSASNYTRQYVFDETTTQPTSVTQTTDYATPLRSIYAYTYDTYGRLTKAQAPEGNFTTYVYDANGNTTNVITTPKGSSDTACGSGHNTICTSAEFIAACPGVNCAHPWRTTDANGNQSYYFYNSLYGYLTKLQHSASLPGGGVEIDYTYANAYAYYKDSTGVISSSGSPINMLMKVTECRNNITCSGTVNETVTNYTYTDSSSPTLGSNLNMLTQSSGAGDGSLTATATMVYDHVGNVTSVDGPLAGSDDTTANFYDADRELVGSIGPTPGLSSGLPNRAVRLTYNADGQVTSSEKGTTSGQTPTAWAAFAPLEQATATYGSDGLKTSDAVLDFATSGHPPFTLTEYSYDGVGRSLCTAVRLKIPSTVSDACTPSSPVSTTFGYDRITKVSYDAANRATLVQQAYGSPDVINYAASTYTLNGQLSTLTDARANVTTYTYDGFDRSDKTCYPNTSGCADYEQNKDYDANSNVTTFRLRDGNTVSMVYDALDRLTGRSGATVPARTFTYDNLNQLTGATLTGGISAGFEYDALGRVTKESSPLGDMTTGYDLAGRRTSLAWPDGFSVTYVRYVTGDLSSVYENGTGGITTTSYTLDNIGRVTGIGKGNGHGQSLGWDSADRLTGLSTVIASGTSTVGLSYSPASQIYQRTASDDALASNVAYNVDRKYEANALNQYTKAGAPGTSYDNNGNLTRLASSTYAYDGDNMLTGGSAGAGLSYDPLNRLYQVPDDGGRRFQYSGGMIVGEYDSSGTLKKRYLPGDGVDNPLVWYDSSGLSDRRYLASDERGSITEVSAQGGAAISNNQYDDWGIPAAANQGRFGYTGQTWLPSVQAWNYKARIYNPVVGRFQQTDPIGYSDGPNWYAYVGNDPLNLIDLLGLAEDQTVTAHCFAGGTWTGSGCTYPATTGNTAIVSGGNTPGQGNEQNTSGPDIVVTGKKAAKKIWQCTKSQYGIGAVGAGMTAVGQPIAGTKAFVTPGSSKGTSLAGLAANAIFKSARSPVRLPMIVGSYPKFLTGRALQVVGTRSIARFAGRAVPIVGLALTAYDVVSISICSLSSGS